MEDIFKFLFVIGIIAIGFVRQARKEAKTRHAYARCRKSFSGKLERCTL